MENKGHSYEPLWTEESDYALIFSRIWCKTLGIWPWERDEFYSLLRTGTLIGIEVAGAVLLVGLLSTRGNCGSIADLIDAITGITVFILSIIKLSFPWYKRQNIENIIGSAIEDWSGSNKVCDGNKYEKIMNKYAAWGRLVFIVQMCSALVAVLEVTLTRLPTSLIQTNESIATRYFVLGPACWAPLTMPFSIYIIYYNIIVMSLWTTALIYAGCDAFMFTFALHICGQFEILNIEIDRMSDGDGGLIQKDQVVDCAKRHNQLLRLADCLDSTVNIIILSEFVSNGFLICITGIAVLINIGSGEFNSDVVNFACRIIIWYMELFMYSFVGETLCCKATEFECAMYNCPWYNMSNSLARDVKFMLMRNKSSCRITAGRVVTINYEAFKDLTHSMFSLFSVLKFMVN